MNRSFRFMAPTAWRRTLSVGCGEPFAHGRPIWPMSRQPASRDKKARTEHHR